ncbi:MAG: 2-oxo acid dehydrogenase subunit E2 [Clostridiaceae bacterium]|nr:2-oxo acid dehydrogenase subunit E2 [Clostridiaceae bacterium]
MATAIIMPRQGQSVESCIIGKWHKQEGDSVSEGDLLFTYETDKATFDEAAKVSGTLIAVFFEEGDDIPVLTNVCVIGEPGEDVSEFDPREAKEVQEEKPATAEAVAAPAAAVQTAAVEAAAAPAGDLPEAISPRARGLAERAGVDLRFAQPTGPKGRVIERDVQKLIDEGRLVTQAAGAAHDTGIAGTGIGGRVGVADLTAAPAASAAAASTTPALAIDAGPESYVEKHTNIRKVIARSMQASLSQMAQLTLNSSFDATDIMALRKRLKAAGEKGLNSELGFTLAEKVPTLNDIILYAASRVLPKHPGCNAHYDDEKLTIFNRVHMGVAVDTPRGLMVPTVFNSDLMSLSQLSSAVKEAVTACQSGTISPDALQGGTFTVTNLGTLDVESFTPVINPPQTCILGVCGITTKVREVNGELKTYPSMGLSLTFDHRAIDGAPAARFLKDLKTVLENFSLLLMQ